MLRHIVKVKTHKIHYKYCYQHHLLAKNRSRIYSTNSTNGDGDDGDDMYVDYDYDYDYEHEHEHEHDDDYDGGGMTDEVNDLINEYSQKLQTPVSLETLTRTGKGELLTQEDLEQQQQQQQQQQDSPLSYHFQNYNNNNNIITNDINNTSSSSSSSQASRKVLIQVASFIHHEMPIRLAKRIKDLEKVPYLSQMPSVQSVKDIYISSFLSLVNGPNPRLEGNSDDDGTGDGTGDGTDASAVVREHLFARKLELLYERHSSVLVQMARGAYELRDLIQKGEMTIDNDNVESSTYSKSSNRTRTSDNSGMIRRTSSSGEDGQQQKLQFEHLNECHAFLDRFYMSRIGIRVLAGQYLALRSPHMEGYIGLICQHTSPYDIVKHAVSDAYYMCEQKYGYYPKVIIKGRLDLTFAYIPTQLHYIILELLKNAMRATVEHHHLKNNSQQLPPVEVIIADGFFNEDVVIKISDEGGGIPRSNTDKIWSYLFTTADPSIQDGLIMQNNSVVDHSVDAPIAGLGYGLPISKSYAKYFGGDVSISSMEGYGTDAFIHLRRLGDSKESLPV